MSKRDVYAKYAYRYAESGICCFPCEAKSKRAFLKNWSQYCNDVPIQTTDLDFWIEQYPEGNIGMPLGSQNNVMCVDIDTNDKEVMAIVPRSPYVKRGAKGETRFFVYNPSIRSKKFNLNGNPIVEILTTGNQTIMPPSIHPTGEIYKWLGSSLVENVHEGDLPPLDESWISKLEQYIIANSKTSAQVVTASASGRNNKLKEICSAMVFEGKAPDEVVNRLIEYDKENHVPMLFSDANEGFLAKSKEDVYKNAHKFYTSIATGIWRKDPTTLKFDSSEIKINLDRIMSDEQKNEAIKIPEYPLHQKSFITLFMEHCRLNSSGNVDALALGGALALLSVLAANRFRATFGQYDVRPNLFVFNIAPSGAGKSAPQNLIKKLVGSKPYFKGSMFKSIAALVEPFPTQQEQLHVLDEASSLLRNANSKSEFLAEISNVLRELYSSSHTFYSGISSKASGFEFGACHNPSLSLLGSLTCKEFDNMTTATNVDGGLMPRFLFFRQDSMGNFRDEYDPKRSEELVTQMKSFISLMEEQPKYKKGSVIDFSQDSKMGNIYDPFECTVSEEAQAYYKYLQRKTFELNSKYNSPFYARKMEQTAKLALLAALARLSTTITVEDIEWASSVWETQYCYSHENFGYTEAHNDFDRYVYKAVYYLSTRDGTITAKSSFNRYLGTLRGKLPMVTKMKQDILSRLESDGTVTVEGSQIKYLGKKQQKYIKIDKTELRAWRERRKEMVAP